MTRIKICGIRDLDTALTALSYGADYLGFIFAGGRRFIEPLAVRAILSALPPDTQSVGVFLNQTPEAVAESVLASGVTHIQLHGEENPEQYLFLGLPIIKAIPVTPEGMVIPTALTHCRYGLLDTRLPGQTGGTGKPFDWRTARSHFPEAPCFVAGGLNPGNVREAVETLRPYGVDVSSGVETMGRKNPELIRQFIEEVRRTR